MFDIPAGGSNSYILLQLETSNISGHLLGKMEDMPGVFLAY